LRRTNEWSTHVRVAADFLREQQSGTQDRCAPANREGGPVSVVYGIETPAQAPDNERKDD
jgi:hypothetical protein